MPAVDLARPARVADMEAMWLGLQIDNSEHVPRHRHRTAIAIPARDEAQRIEACLMAIDASAAAAAPSSVEVVVLVNNSTDATAEIVRRTSVPHLRVDVVEVTFADGDANAGRARRHAMDPCAARLPDGGVIMTTDADSRVDRGWIAAMLVEIEAGNDAVAGVVTFDAGTSIEASPERAKEWQLAHLHAQLHAMLDPRPQEQWPTHIWAWGASLAVTAGVYRAVGGLPDVPLAEDRAFADVLDRRGFKVRRSDAPIVYTSARHAGRAPGGFADLLRSYVYDPTTLCDAAIEPTADLVRRLRWRSRLRRSHAHAGPRLCERASMRLQISSTAVSYEPGDGFGDWWRAIEAASPRLRRQRVHPTMLAGELRQARRVIARIERAREDRADNRGSCAGTRLAGG